MPRSCCQMPRPRLVPQGRVDMRWSDGMIGMHRLGGRRSGPRGSGRSSRYFPTFNPVVLRADRPLTPPPPPPGPKLPSRSSAQSWAEGCLVLTLWIIHLYARVSCVCRARARAELPGFGRPQQHNDVQMTGKRAEPYLRQKKTHRDPATRCLVNLRMPRRRATPVR